MGNYYWDKKMNNKRVKYYQIIIFSIILFFLSSCEKDKLEAPQSCYSVKYTEPMIYHVGNSVKLSYSNYLGFTQYSDHPINLTKYVKDEDFKIFQNSTLEIQDIFTIRFNVTQWEIFNFFISVNNKNQALYLIWKEIDTIKTKNNLSLQLNLNSDTVYSNIGEGIFKTIFPKFKGKLIDGNVKEITIKHDYRIFDHLFYLDVKFDGLEVGDYEYWRKGLDTLMYYDKYWDKIKQKKLDSITRSLENKYRNLYSKHN